MKTSPKGAHLCVMVVSLLAIMGAGLSPSLAVRPTALAASTTAPIRTGLAVLPEALQGAVSAALGADDPAYRVTVAGMQYQAVNPRQGLTALLGQQGFVVHSAAAEWQLRLVGWGRGENRQELAAGKVAARMNRVEVDRGSMLEWWVNGPLGLEQGWTVAQPPQSAGEGSLTLCLAQSGSLQARAGVDGQTLAIVDSAGRDVLHYAGLVAADARGRALPAHFEIAGGALRVVVDDAQAVYPIRIDPWVQTAVLTAADGVANDNLGKSVAISADGSTVVAGIPYKKVNSNEYQGAVYVFVKPAAGWATGVSTARLLASDGAADDYLGSTVAISADGTTIVAGAASKTVGANGSQGAVYVFVKPASGGWVNATQTARLTASDGVTNDRLGGSVAVNSDGTTVVAGASSKNSSKGQVYVFVKPASGEWVDATEKARLTASDAVAYNALGHSVAASGDGGTIAAGASEWNEDRGAVYVFVKPASAWVNGTQKAILTTSDYKTGGSDFFGSSVAISSDGSTVAAGAPTKDIGSIYAQGEVYVFVKPAGDWVNATEKAVLKDSTNTEYAFLGNSVSVSSDGAIVAAGAPLQESLPAPKPGAVLLYNRPASGWANTVENARLTATGVTSINLLGTSVAFSGSIIASGAPDAQVGSNLKQGAVYLFKLYPSKIFLPQVRK